ncbi:SH3 domain-containing protein [Pseudaestuariivita atlantica]|uniref:SH3 domain-containing protein n=1 Tax=Pseudaestuariivita atlantica TaxID=1317121 RepID=UPI003BF88B1A
MVPLVIAVGFFALVGSVFESSNSRSTPYSPSAVPSSQTADAAYVYVTGTRVNQRAGPSTSNAVMGVLSEGTRVEKLREEGQWTQIRSNFGTGWMATSFLSLVAPPTERPTSQDRSLRASDVRIIDGDTIDVRGLRANVRLVGFNAPETWRPSCTVEREIGERATARLGQLVRGATSIEFERVACSCRPGTEGTDQCNFGRFCGSAARCSLTVRTSAARSLLKVWPCRTDVDAPAVPRALNPGADSRRAHPTQTTDLPLRRNADPPHRERDGSLSRCIGSERTGPSSVTIDGFDGGF